MIVNIHNLQIGNKLRLIIAHYYPEDVDYPNPLIKTLKSIISDYSNNDIEIIIADDGSSYSKFITNSYSKKVSIKNDDRQIFFLEDDKLVKFLLEHSLPPNLISKWVYLPKVKKCMSKAKVLNYSVLLSSSENLFFLDDDNYLISQNSIKSLYKLFNKYNFIVGQIKDNNNRMRLFSSNRVQGTTIAINKDIINKIGGFGEWTEEFSCGVDSDFWIKMYQYYLNHKIKVCYTNKLKTYDSFSKRWGKFTKLFRNYKIKKEFNKIYNCINYKDKKYNLARNKSLWIEDLIEK